RRARRPAGDAGAGGNVEADVRREVDLDELGSGPVGVRARRGAGVVAVLADAQTEIEAVDVVAEVAQDVPEGERVLPSRHRHQYPIARLDHVEVVEGLAHLLPAVVQEAVPAEPGIVAADVDDRRRPATSTLHAGPPETTGRIWTWSSSPSCTSP